MKDNLDLVPITVDVQVTEKVTDEEIDKCFERQGVKLDSKTLRDMRKVGIYVRGQGVTHGMYGTAVTTQQVALQNLAKITKAIDEYSGKRVNVRAQHLAALATASASLMARITDSLELMRRLGGPVASPINAQDEEPVHNRSFKPGADVKPPASGTVVVAQHAHFHESKDLPKKE